MPYTSEVEDLFRPSSDYNLTWRGVEFGDGTPYDITTIEGLDLPGLRTADTDRPLDHGSYLGRMDYMQARTITLGIEVMDTNPDSLWQRIKTLEDLTIPGGGTSTMVIKLPHLGTWSTEVRLRRRARPIDQALMRGTSTMLLEFTAPDPLLYSSLLTSAALETYHNARLTHVGNIGVRPTYEIRGAVKNPAINRFDTPGYEVERFSLAIEMGEQDVLTIDRMGMPRLNNVPAYQYVVPGSVLPMVYPGVTNIGYIGEDDGRSRCTVFFRSTRV